jgi:uncharacterized protein
LPSAAKPTIFTRSGRSCHGQEIEFHAIDDRAIVGNRLLSVRRLLLVLLALLAFAIPALAHDTELALTGRVVDAADLLPPADEAALTERLADYERRTGHQLVVVTVPSLEGQTIDAYTLALAKRWGIGRRDFNDGLVVLVAPNERMARIEVGLGLEQRLTNDRAAEIMKSQMIPAFGSGDFPRGIVDGVEAIMATVPD